MGPKDAYLGTVTPWQSLFCAGDWVRHPAPAFFLERACLTGIEAANAVLEARGLEKFALIEYLPAEPFVAWIEKLMKRGRQKRRERKLKKKALSITSFWDTTGRISQDFTEKALKISAFSVLSVKPVYEILSMRASS